MLRLTGEQVESLFDEALPAEVRQLPEDLERLDKLLEDPELLRSIEAVWGVEDRGHGRPTIPMASYVRLMVVKQRTGWGYETLVREVSDSIHLRRFCLVSLSSSVPDESTIRKLTRRLGPEVVAELTRAVIRKARRESRFRARAARCDSTVIEADIRWPSDAGLALDGVRALARQGARVARAAGGEARRVRDRSRAVAKRLRLIGRTVARRTGGARETVLALTGEAGELLRRSIGEARRLASEAGEHARGRGARAKLAAAHRLEELAERAEKVARQIDQRLAGERITDRLVSLADPDARPIRKGKAGRPVEFGYVFQLTELTEHTRRGARGFLLPPKTLIGSPNETELLPLTASELEQAGVVPREVALDGGFEPTTTNPLLPEGSEVFIAGRQQPDSRHTRRRLARYRVGCEGRISHLKRSYGLRRTRLRGQPGAETWVGWSAFAYNLDTLAIRAG